MALCERCRGQVRSGAEGEVLVAMELRAGGRDVEIQPYKHSFDILVDHKWKCEVKTAKPIYVRGSLAWLFNIHRHGVLDEGGVDLYILQLKEIHGSKKPIYLVIKAPLQVSTISFTLHELIKKGAPLVEDFLKLKAGLL